MTFGDIQTDVKHDLGLTASPPTAVANRVKRNINKGHRIVMADPAMSKVRDTLEPLTFTSEASLNIYGLPASIAVPRAITERDTDRRLGPLTIDDLRSTDPGLTSSGTPYGFIPLGFRPLKRLPDQATGKGIWVASSSAADTTQTALANAIQLGGLRTGDIGPATLNGVTRVQIGLLTDLIDFQSLSISAVAAGIVSFFDAAAAGNTLAQIPIGDTSPRYFCVQLYPSPTGATVYYIDGTLRGLDMDDDQDEPLIPEDFHDMLTDYARACEHERMGDAQRFAMAMQKFNDSLVRLRSWCSSLPSDEWVLGRPSRRRYSRYGPWFPAETW